MPERSSCANPNRARRRAESRFARQPRRGLAQWRMRLHIGADHAGFELKAALIEHLTAAGHEVVDHGAFAYDAQDDYPAFCFGAAEAVVAEPGSLGIVIGGSGNGEQIAANKVTGVRAALAWSLETARLAVSTTTRTWSPSAGACTRRLRRSRSSTRSSPSRSATTRVTSAASTRSPPTRPRARPRVA